MADDKKKNQCRRWTFTEYNLENYVRFAQLFETLGSTVIRYLVYQGETCPQTGNKHLQGYVEFITPRRLGGVKRLLESKTIHAVPSQGTAKQNTTYCTKEKSADKSTFPPVILGKPAGNGKNATRKDIERLYSMISKGATEFQISNAFPAAYLRYHKAISKMRQMWVERDLPKWKDIPVSVYYGETRTGKTRKVFADHDDVYKLSIKQSGNVWFDGYTGQKTLLIDDFYGQIKVSYLLQLLDGYKQQVEIKGGFRWAQWDRIYITSNCHPSEWYNCWEYIPDDVADAVGARITDITEIKQIEKKKRKNRWVKRVIVRTDAKGVGVSTTPNPRHSVTRILKQTVKNGGPGLSSSQKRGSAPPRKPI